MAFQIKLICLCGHPEMRHRLRDKSSEEILNTFITRKQIEPQYQPDSIAIEQYFFGSSFHSKEEVLKKIGEARDTFSSCQNMMCQCKSFRADNLKSLENLYEHTASKIIY
jgi:hypothetical protein